jgi:hypothetical protein
MIDAEGRMPRGDRGRGRCMEALSELAVQAVQGGGVMSIKLVNEPDTRTFLERFSTPPERMRRVQRFAKMAISVLDAIEALDPEEHTVGIENMDLSQQEITEMCRVLDANTKHTEYNNDRASRYLRSLTPKRIWMGRK